MKPISLLITAAAILIPSLARADEIRFSGAPFVLDTDAILDVPNIPGRKIYLLKMDSGALNFRAIDCNQHIERSVAYVPAGKTEMIKVQEDWSVIKPGTGAHKIELVICGEN